MAVLSRTCLLLNVLVVAYAAVPKPQQHLRAVTEKSEKTAAVALVKGNVSENQATSLTQYYDTVTTERGIWKWNNALAAYDRHFTRFKNVPLKLGEVGLWSGGSIWMWQAVMGAQCYVYGFDIMETALAFNDARTTVTIMDQGIAANWVNFFATVSPTVDIMIDDGGHQAHQMLTTTEGVWPHLTAGGIMAIEDILGAHYLPDFFTPVANFYGARAAEVSSMHIYPLVLIVEKLAPGIAPPVFGAQGAIQVNTLEALVAALGTAPPGSSILLENAAWGSFHLQPNLLGFFQTFNGLHSPQTTASVPVDCHKTSQATCAYSLVNSDQQNKITGVHIFPTQLVVEMAPAPPVIQAVRKGTNWVQYAHANR